MALSLNPPYNCMIIIIWNWLIYVSVAALRHYNEVNGDLPERVLIYRDGVGDGQLGAVVEHEVPQLKASFADVAGGYK